MQRRRKRPPRLKWCARIIPSSPVIPYSESPCGDTDDYFARKSTPFFTGSCAMSRRDGSGRVILVIEAFTAAAYVS